MYKIFMIEDDEIVADIYKHKLEAEGYSVEVAHNGEDGYEKLRTFKPDLLLLDMMLPGLTGADLLVLLRGKDEFKDLPIIAFSGSDSVDVLEDAKRFGATRVLSKGEFTPGQIVARITETLSAFTKPSEELIIQTLTEWKPPIGRILVVEDDPIIMALVKDIIEEEGYTVVTAQDGREAYKILESDNNFIAGIFDVRVPYIHGPDLIRHMQTERRLMKIPVLIMTAEQGFEVQADSLSAGAVLFIPKPFRRATLKSMFHTLCKKSETNRIESNRRTE